jgi:DNA-binding CsgD family transcriptional regulator
MLPLQQLQDLGLSPDLSTLRRRLEEASNALGFGLFTAMLIRGALGKPSASIDVIANPTAGFVDAMNDLGDALRDPVTTALRTGAMPVVYDQSTYCQAGVMDLWDAQAPFGYRCGIACSTHEPSHLESFMFGVDRPDALPTDLVGRMRLTGAVQMLTLHAQAAMQRIFTPAPSGAPVLDDVELECLKWARDGYTVQKVSDRLVISSVEVRHRQRSAVRKTGASSLQGAVLRCIQGGLID